MRQSVLANNLANAETPGYRRMDVDFHDALAQAMGSAVPATIEATSFTPQQDPQSMSAAGMAMAARRALRSRRRHRVRRHGEGRARVRGARERRHVNLADREALD